MVSRDKGTKPGALVFPPGFSGRDPVLQPGVAR
jgi:hypothetical protein